MIIYPAIDMLGGKCVRLKQGRYDDSTVYGENPAEIAKQWAKCGAEWIHLVDLDGAKIRKPVNVEAIKAIRESVDVKLQLGGGIRHRNHIKMLLDMGIDRVILGTAAVMRPYFMYQMIKEFGAERIVAGLDAKDGKLATSGWESTKNQDVFGYAQFMEQIGVKTVIFTDIATDGMLQGPNLEAMKKMVSGVNIDVIASGGVSCNEDLAALKELKAGGAIVGKALYNGNVKLEEIINAC